MYGHVRAAAPRRCASALALSCSFIETVPTHPDRRPGSPSTYRSILMSDLRALLLTDVVDSTKLSLRVGDAEMARLWAAHDRAARDLLPRWRGREIDKSDGMLLLFDTAADAVQYASAYHRALATLPVPLKARAGLHVGHVILRENPPEDVTRGAKQLEVDGLAKPTAARVMSLARGGQTLLTAEAREDLACFPQPAGLHVGSHGHWVVKGLADPIELFEVGDDPSSFAAPPDSEKVHRVVQSCGRWMPVRQVPNNLPELANAFIGRERELADIRELLGKTRLVTLLGMGGLGKTRLSLQVAAELMAEFPDGVWFLDLAPLRDDNLVLAEAAQVLGVREEPGRPLLQSMGQHLKELRSLLILDNCEHLLKATATLTHALLRVSPRVAFIASSRAPLRVGGEYIYPILPLPVPAATDGVAALSQFTAVRLFVERAQEQRPNFELTEAEAPAVAELVARLEGIPLALELAAARLRALSVADINQRLKNRYKLLTGGNIVRDERQQTLRALVDWSYDMLTPPEQAMLQRLAVFRGGFDPPAAEAVCAGDDIEADDVLDLLTSLVDKSLVTMEQRDGKGRFRLLETIREYSAEKLAESGGARAAAARHCQFFFVLSKQARDGMQGPRQREWLDRLDLEHDNLRAAMALPQAEDSGVDPFIALKMAVALQNFWIMHGGTREGRAVVQTMLKHPAVAASPMARAHGLYVGAALAGTQGDLDEALRMLNECLALRRGLGNPIDLAGALSTLAITRMSSGDPQGALADVTEALALFRQSGHRIGEAICLLQLGEVQVRLGQADAARTNLLSALAIAREIKHAETEGEAELALGDVELDAGHEAEAERHFQRSLMVCSAAGDLGGEATARWALGRTDLRAGRLAAARPRMREALVAFDVFEMRGPWVGCIEDHAALALALDDLSLACGLSAAAQRLRDSTHLVRSPQTQERWQERIAQLRSALGAQTFNAVWTAACEWDADEVRRRALGLDAAASD
jgi:predicted ATPase/class 3 adenylate cyclase